MSIVMAKKKIEPRSRSAYQTHVTVLFTTFDVKNIVDISERKLVRMATTHEDENIRKLAARMLHDYMSGKIAIAWECNLPVYMFLKPRTSVEKA